MRSSERVRVHVRADEPSLALPFARLRSIALPLALAVIAGGAAWIAAQSAQALAAIELGPGARARVPAMSVFALAALLSLCVLRPAATRIVGRSGASVVTLAFLALTPLVVGAALVRLDVPIVSWWWGARVVDPAQRFATAFAAAASAGTIIALVACARPGPRLRRGLDVAALLAIALGALLFLPAAARAARAVDPSRFVASLPIVGVIRGGFRPSLPDDPFVALPDSDADEIVSSWGLSMRRTCLSSGLDPTRADQCTLIVTSRGVDQPEAASFDVRPSSTLTLRRDADHGIFVLDEDGRRRRSLDASGLPVDVAVADVADRLGPPTEWIFVAGLGLAIACVALLRGRRARHAADLVAAGAEGMLDGSRWIHVEGEAPLRAPDAIPNHAGPVVVIASAPVGVRSVYRADDSVRPATVIIGAKSDLVARFRDAASASSALAVVAVAITASPLVAAAIRGLVV